LQTVHLDGFEEEEEDEDDDDEVVYPPFICTFLFLLLSALSYEPLPVLDLVWSSLEETDLNMRSWKSHQ
jgi:hypothetical protein